MASEGGFTTESETDFSKQRKRPEANPPHRPGAKRTKQDHFTDKPISNYKDSGVAKLLQTNEHEPLNPAAMLANPHIPTPPQEDYIQANSRKLNFIAEKGDRLDFAPSLAITS
jgi:hypothetical protein